MVVSVESGDERYATPVEATYGNGGDSTGDAGIEGNNDGPALGGGKTLRKGGETAWTLGN